MPEPRPGAAGVPEAPRALAPAPWHRQPGESGHAFDAFRSYRDQRAPRDLRRVFDSRGTQLPMEDTLVLFRAMSWRQRAEAWDGHNASIVEAQTTARLREGAEEIAERHLGAIRMGLDLAENELRKLLGESLARDFPVVKPQVLIALLDKAVSLERLVRGEATGRLEVENTGPDFSRLTPEELRAWLEMQEKIGG